MLFQCFATPGPNHLSYRSYPGVIRTPVPILLIAALIFLYGMVSNVGAEIIGRSVEDRAIEVHTIGKEQNRSIIIIGGIHGGYEWNTIVLARRVLSYVRNNPDTIPAGFRLHVIPNMNPDGLHRITEGKSISETDMQEKNTTPGRFNARGIDLNRNWDHEWQPVSYWGNRKVDAGENPFSEPETRVVQDFIMENRPSLVIFFQSAANGIWYSGKQVQWAPARRFAQVYSEASGYPLPEGTEGPVSYEITGSASGYLYTQKVPTLVIEMATHHEIEFERNLAGLRAVFELVSSSSATDAR